jgi:hypothetical protein
VNDITLLDSWDISAQGHFTNNTDLFPRKIGNSFNGCPMKAVVRNGVWPITTYVTYSNLGDVETVGGLEFKLLMIALKQIKMTFESFPEPEDFQIHRALTSNLSKALFEKKAYIALGNVGSNLLEDSFLGSTNPHTIMRGLWYVPCPDKYQRWSSMFRILSVELWIVLIISIVVVAISTTILARYSCTSEWQVYKTVTSSLTNIWSVILGVAVSTMPRATSLRLLFLAWVCFCIAFSTVFQAFLTTFLVDPGYKKPIENMDEVFASGMFVRIQSEYLFLFWNDTAVMSNYQRQPKRATQIYYLMECVFLHKNMSVFATDLIIDYFFAFDRQLFEISQTMMCKLEDGMVYNYGLSMIMFHADPLLRRVSEIFDRVFEAGLYNHWISMLMNEVNAKQQTRKIALVHPLDEYYSFKIYHMQPAFYLLLMGWCLSSLCFMVELLFNRFLSKRK